MTREDLLGRAYWKARITLPDGERVWVGGRSSTKARAEEFADEKSREATRRKLTLKKMAPTPKKTDVETCDAWHARYLAFCKEQGITTTKTKGERWGKWVSPKLGAKAPASVTRDDAEDVRDALDAAIRARTTAGPGEGRLAPKTAANIWIELTVSFSEMFSSKRRDLRVIESNPVLGVQPSERGRDKSRVYPYPSEFLGVVSCEDVPLEWRELHAVSVSTYARPGELRALQWSDVDLGNEQICITKAWDFDALEVKSTKTHETRTIPIDPELLPLLRVMRARSGGKGLSRTGPSGRGREQAGHHDAATLRDRRLRPCATERPKQRRASPTLPFLA